MAGGLCDGGIVVIACRILCKCLEIKSVALAHICVETANVLCHNRAIARYITGVHNEDNGFRIS